MAMHLIPASDEEMQKVYQRRLFLNVAYKMDGGKVFLIQKRI